MQSFTVMENDQDQRLDKFLQKALPHIPKSALYKALRTKRIKLNKRRADGAVRLAAGDVITVFLHSEPESAQKPLFFSAPPDVDVVYEDQHVIFLYKPPGLLVHEDANQKHDTLINRMLHYLYAAKQYDPKAENSFVPALCNRLDRHTEGIVLGAKTAAALRLLNDAIRHGCVHKQYLAIVHGTPHPKSAVRKAFCRKNDALTKMEVFDHPVAGGRTMHTSYRVLGAKGRFSLLEIDLLTGRTHQIRSHMAHIGHPLLGDGKYGVLQQDRALGYTHQALCAYKVAFPPTCFAKTPLSHLGGMSFSLPAVSFVQDFWQGKIQ